MPVALFGFRVRRLGPTEAAILLEFQLVGSRTLVLGRGIISPLALPASQSNGFSHGLYPYFDL